MIGDIRNDWCVTDVATMSHHRLVSFYLMSSYLYYKAQPPVSALPDEVFDQICKRLLVEWGEINHQHKQYIPHEDLPAGTGFSISHYPSMVCHASQQWFNAMYPPKKG